MPVKHPNQLPPKVIFWVDFPSLLHESVASSISRNPNTEVVVVADRPLPAARVRLGWVQPGFDGVDVRISPNTREINGFFEKSDYPALHLFFGPFSYKTVKFAFQRSLTRQNLYRFIVSEANQYHTLKGKLSWLKHLVYTLMYRTQVHATLGLGELGARWFRRLGYSPSSCFQWAYFVPEYRFQAGSYESPPPHSKMKFLFLGQFNHRKGVDVLLRALTHLKDSPFELELYGTGPDEARFRGLVGEYGIEKMVRFNGPLPSTQVDRILSSFDSLVLPSRFDGWGFVVSEALAQGLRVIVSDKCGASSLVSSDRVGDIVRAESVEALAGAIKRQVNTFRTVSRSDIRSLAGSSICGKAGARYLKDIFLHVAYGNTRPATPWESAGHKSS